MSQGRYTVSQVAALAHTTVRALHHYDEIGLLVPSQRSDAGYRIYLRADIERLRDILLFRELGFALEEIRRLLDAPAADRLGALRDQRELLVERVNQTRSVITALDRTLRQHQGENTVSTDNMFEGFEDFDHSQYEREVQQRWSNTDAYKEASRRTKGYSKDELAAIKAEGESLVEQMGALLKRGDEPQSTDAAGVAERHRLHIDRWFYPCSHAMHAGLAEMYVADERFAAHFERHGDGLAAFFAAAIRANAAAAG